MENIINNASVKEVPTKDLLETNLDQTIKLSFEILHRIIKTVVINTDNLNKIIHDPISTLAKS